MGQLGRNSLTSPFGSTAADMSSLLPIDFAQSLLAEPVVDLSVRAGNHVCAVFGTLGTVCWGSNSNGALGTGDTIDRGGAANEMSMLAPIAFAITNTVVQVSAGAVSTCALFSHGGIMCWGKNTYGQLGNDSASTSVFYANTVSPIAFADTIPAVQMDLWEHACAVFANSRVR